MLCKAPYMELIDNQILHRQKRRLQVLPVKIIFNHAGLIMLIHRGGSPPHALTRNSLGIRIQKITVLIKNQPLFRLVGPVHPVSVFKFFNIQFKNNHGIHIADAVMLRKRKHGKRLILFPVEQKKLNGGGSMGMNREVYTSRNCRSSVNFIKSGTHLKAVYIVQRNQMNGPGKTYLLDNSVLLRRYTPCLTFTHIKHLLFLYRKHLRYTCMKSSP